MGTGQYERGIQAVQEDLRLNPDDTFAYGGLAEHNFFLDRFAEAADALRRASERKLEIPEFLVLRYYLAFFKGDQAGMEREIARARGEQGAEDWMSHNQALVLARSGQMRQARIMWERAVALAQQAGNRERAAIYKSAEAVCEAHFGNAAEAKRRAAAALDFAKGRDVEYSAAFALALSGDGSGSQRLAEDLEKRFPEDTPVQFEYLPTLRALFALTHGRRRWTRSSNCNGRFLTTSRCRARRSLPSSEASIPRIYAARRTLQQDGPGGRGGISKGSRIIAASFSPIL